MLELQLYPHLLLHSLGLGCDCGGGGVAHLLAAAPHGGLLLGAVLLDLLLGSPPCILDLLLDNPPCSPLGILCPQNYTGLMSGHYWPGLESSHIEMPEL